MAQTDTRALPRDLWTGNPEDFNTGGRDNIDVEIVKARYAPDHYPNKTKHFCFARFTFRNLEDEQDEFQQIYRVAFLNRACPTNSDADTPKEEREPAGGDDSVYQQLADGLVQLEENELEDYEGRYIMGRPDGDSDYLIFVRALVECGFAPQGPDISQFEGLPLHLDRGKGSSYKDKDTQEEKFSSILLPSAILPGGKKGEGNSSASASASKGKASDTKANTTSKPAASTSSKKAASNGSSALDAVAQAIIEIIENDGEDGAIEKGKAIVKLTKKEQFKSLSAADRKVATDAFNDDSLFNPSRGLVYDSDDDMIRTL